MSQDQKKNVGPLKYSTYDNKSTNEEIRRAASTGIYKIRGGGAKRSVPDFNDLTVIFSILSRSKA